MKLTKNPKFIIPSSIIGAFVFICLAGLAVNNSPLQLSGSRDLYKKALEYQNNANATEQNDLKLALTTYDKISPSYPAYDIVLLQEARCATALGDEKNVLLHLQTLLENYPESPVAAQASYNLGQAYVRINDKDQAKKQFLQTIEKYPDTEYSHGSRYYLGEIYCKKNKNRAAQYLLDYLGHAPDGRFAADAINDIESLKVNLSQENRFKIAVALFTDKNYDKALVYFNKIPLKKSWYYLVKIYQAKGERAKALHIIKAEIKNTNGLSPEQIHDAMLAYVNLNQEPATKSWSEIIHTLNKAKDFSLYKQSQLINRDAALQIYKLIAYKYPESQYASEALWKLFWYDFNNKNYDEAIKLGIRHIDLYNNTKAAPKMIFWVGKAYERKDERSLAINYYKKLLSQYPDSYYAFRADGRLKAMEQGRDPGWLTELSDIGVSEPKIECPYNYEQIKQKFNPEAAELIEVGDYQTALVLVHNDHFIESWIRHKQGLTSSSIMLARDEMNKLMPKPELGDTRWKLIYPLHFVDKIAYYSKLNRIDPVIVLSLLKEESYFNPLAVSSSNARGLMQLMPGTARDIARWAKYGSVNSFELFNPDTNIKLGTTYLKHTSTLLSDSSLYAVAAYNGGPVAVRKWLNIMPHDDMDQFIENIPYSETRNYIKKVYASYWNYKRIYNLS